MHHNLQYHTKSSDLKIYGQRNFNLITSPNSLLLPATVTSGSGYHGQPHSLVNSNRNYSTLNEEQADSPFDMSNTNNKFCIGTSCMASPESARSSPELIHSNLCSLAEQISLIESKLFRAITREELLSGGKWSGPEKYTRAENIVNSIRWGNQLTFWVETEVLKHQDVHSRASVLCNFIRLMRHLLDMQNYGSAMALHLGLQSMPIHRLKQTWAKLPAKETKIYENMARLLSFEDNHKNLRENLQQAALPCVPFLGIFLYDLTYLSSAASNLRSASVEPLPRLNRIPIDSEEPRLSSKTMISPTNSGPIHRAPSESEPRLPSSPPAFFTQRRQPIRRRANLLSVTGTVGPATSASFVVVPSPSPNRRNLHPSSASSSSNNERQFEILLQSIANFQSTPYKFHAIDQVQSKLSKLQYLEEFARYISEGNYKKSLELEPSPELNGQNSSCSNNKNTRSQLPNMLVGPGEILKPQPCLLATSPKSNRRQQQPVAKIGASSPIHHLDPFSSNNNSTSDSKGRTTTLLPPATLQQHRRSGSWTSEDHRIKEKFEDLQVKQQQQYRLQEETICTSFMGRGAAAGFGHSVQLPTKKSARTRPPPPPPPPRSLCPFQDRTWSALAIKAWNMLEKNPAAGSIDQQQQQKFQVCAEGSLTCTFREMQQEPHQVSSMLLAKKSQQQHKSQRSPSDPTTTTARPLASSSGDNALLLLSPPGNRKPTTARHGSALGVIDRRARNNHLQLPLELLTCNSIEDNSDHEDHEQRAPHWAVLLYSQQNGCKNCFLVTFPQKHDNGHQDDRPQWPIERFCVDSGQVFSLHRVTGSSSSNRFNVDESPGDYEPTSPLILCSSSTLKGNHTLRQRATVELILLKAPSWLTMHRLRVYSDEEGLSRVQHCNAEPVNFRQNADLGQLLPLFSHRICSAHAKRPTTMTYNNSKQPK